MEQVFGASLKPTDANMQLPELLIILIFILASQTTSRIHSTPKLHPQTLGIHDSPPNHPKNVLARSQVTHVGREGAADDGFVPLHVVIGCLITHFTINILITFLLRAKFQ